MRLLLAFALVCMTAGVAGAVDTSARFVQPVKGVATSMPGQPDLREGGENFGSAWPIGGLPFSDAGYTCDNADDITLTTCGYGYYSPDVVYSYVAGTTGTMTVSLCGSDYDTMVGVFNSSFAEIACNDDYCGLQSQVDVAVTAGQLYYIVVDGYYGGCGNYALYISQAGPCEIVCPSGALIEGEPDCYDGYYDSYNGGCNSVGWQDICPTSGNHADMCGKSGTYYYYGLSYRDTDWFTATGIGGTMTMTLNGGFSDVLIFIYGTDCNNPLYDYTTGNPCQPITLSRYVADGAVVWPWVGPNGFGTGIPCGSDYVLSLDGIKCQGTAVENTSWGTIKARY